MIQKNLLESLIKATNKLGLNTKDVGLTRPSNVFFGDFTSNVALKLSKTLKKNSYDLAKEIADNIPANKIVKKIEVIKPGYINFLLDENIILNEIKKEIKTNKKQKIILEFGQPNTHKVPHIGHLFSYIYGESLTRLLQFLGNNVKRLNYQGDIGLHVAKCLYIVDKEKSEIKNLKTLKQKINFLQKSYRFKII